MSFTFTNQMEENTHFSLHFPYHMDYSKLLSTDAAPSNLPAECSVGSFDRLLHKAYTEPLAFYLTDEDKKFYSAQELTLLEKVIAVEQYRVSHGMCIVDLTLDEETMEYLEMYKKANNLTFEDAITDIMQKIVQDIGTAPAVNN